MLKSCLPLISHTSPFPTMPCWGLLEANEQKNGGFNIALIYKIPVVGSCVPFAMTSMGVYICMYSSMHFEIFVNNFKPKKYIKKWLKVRRRGPKALIAPKIPHTQLRLWDSNP